jgi:hypothetical protein
VVLVIERGARFQDLQKTLSDLWHGQDLLWIAAKIVRSLSPLSENWCHTKDIVVVDVL